MINYLEVLHGWVNESHSLLVILVVLYCLTATIDMVTGTINAALTTTIEFRSKAFQLGIMRKVVTLGLMIVIMPLSLMLPLEVGVYSLTILYIGIVVSEIYSIMGHIGMVKDGNKHKNKIGELFSNILETILNRKMGGN